MELDESHVVQSSLRGHKAAVNAVAFESENIFATGSDDSTVRVWDLRTHKSTRCMFGCFNGKAVDSVTFGGHERHCGQVLYAAAGQHIYGFDLRKDGVLDKQPQLAVRACAEGSSDTEVECLGLHPSGESLLVGDSNGTVTIFDSTSFHVKAQLGGVHSSIVTSLSIGSPDNHDNCHVFSGALIAPL